MRDSLLLPKGCPEVVLEGEIDEVLVSERSRVPCEIIEPAKLDLLEIGFGVPAIEF